MGQLDWWPKPQVFSSASNVNTALGGVPAFHHWCCVWSLYCQSPSGPLLFIVSPEEFVTLFSTMVKCISLPAERGMWWLWLLRIAGFLAFIAIADKRTLFTNRMATADLELPHWSKTPKMSHCLVPLCSCLCHVYLVNIYHLLLKSPSSLCHHSSRYSVYWENRSVPSKIILEITRQWNENGSWVWRTFPGVWIFFSWWHSWNLDCWLSVTKQGLSWWSTFPGNHRPHRDCYTKQSKV